MNVELGQLYTSEVTCFPAASRQCISVIKRTEAGKGVEAHVSPTEGD